MRRQPTVRSRASPARASAVATPLRRKAVEHGEPVHVAAPSVPCRDQRTDDATVDLGQQQRFGIVARAALRSRRRRRSRPVWRRPRSRGRAPPRRHRHARHGSPSRGSPSRSRRAQPCRGCRGRHRSDAMRTAPLEPPKQSEARSGPGPKTGAEVRCRQQRGDRPADRRPRGEGLRRTSLRRPGRRRSGRLFGATLFV